jgi:hypothetical protein
MLMSHIMHAELNSTMKCEFCVAVYRCLVVAKGLCSGCYAGGEREALGLEKR